MLLTMAGIAVFKGRCQPAYYILIQSPSLLSHFTHNYLVDRSLGLYGEEMCVMR